MHQLHNRRDLEHRRQELRRELPRAEVLLWSRLQRKQLLNCKFRRQHSVGHYVIDFYAAEIRLAVELDGDSHAWPGRPQHDAERDQFLRGVGIQVVRIPNEEVFDNLEGVMELLARVIRERRGEGTPPTPPLSGGAKTEEPSLTVIETSGAPPARGGLRGVLPSDGDAPRPLP